jgi:dihydropyrimidine dehydrogenase (NAD+) subunit PreA
VEDCITMKELALGEIDPRTGRKVEPYLNWPKHPTNTPANCGVGPEAAE